MRRWMRRRMRRRMRRERRRRMIATCRAAGLSMITSAAILSDLHIDINITFLSNCTFFVKLPIFVKLDIFVMFARISTPMQWTRLKLNWD